MIIQYTIEYNTDGTNSPGFWYLRSTTGGSVSTRDINEIPKLLLSWLEQEHLHLARVIDLGGVFRYY